MITNLRSLCWERQDRNKEAPKRPQVALFTQAIRHQGVNIVSSLSSKSTK